MSVLYGAFVVFCVAAFGQSVRIGIRRDDWRPLILIVVIAVGVGLAVLLQMHAEAGES